MGGSMSPNAGLSFLSPRRDEPRIVEMPVQGGVMPEKPVCTKKLRRRYVEEDDATSVITSEEDDCISPGYHTSLPMEVHGSCYSEMQMISQASYHRLRCSSVVITQHSFDLETFTYYVISLLCQKHQKIYNVFYDWAYEVISVCPLSQTIVCMLTAQFSARDQPLAICIHCTGRMDCVFHNRQYESRILFTWNMESGQWLVLDYGELKEVHEQFNPLKRLGKARLTFAQMAKKMGKEMAVSLGLNLPDYTSNLRVLNSDIRKSKMFISDLDNMVEFHLKRTHHETL
nr:GM05651p [Drosophila melanogaster]